MSKKSSGVDDDLITLLIRDNGLKSLIELEIKDKNRLETFVGGVFAIAITLLVLEFVLPVLPHSNTALLAYLAVFGLSF